MMIMAFMFLWWQEGGIKVRDSEGYCRKPALVKMDNKKYLVLWTESQSNVTSGVRMMIYDTCGERVRGGDTGVFTGVNNSGYPYMDVSYNGDRGEIYFIWEINGIY